MFRENRWNEKWVLWEIIQQNYFSILNEKEIGSIENVYQKFRRGLELWGKMGDILMEVILLHQIYTFLISVL